MNESKPKRVRKPLGAEEQRECALLKAIFEAEKSKNPSLTQDSLSEAIGYKTQGAISHYLNGIHPLNLEAAIKFALALNCKIEDFSPRLAATVAPLHKLVSPDFTPPTSSEPALSRDAQRLIDRLKALDAVGGSSPQLYRAIEAVLDVVVPPAEEAARGHPDMAAMLEQFTKDPASLTPESIALLRKKMQRVSGQSTNNNEQTRKKAGGSGA